MNWKSVGKQLHRYRNWISACVAIAGVTLFGILFLGTTKVSVVLLDIVMSLIVQILLSLFGFMALAFLLCVLRDLLGLSLPAQVLAGRIWGAPLLALILLPISMGRPLRLMDVLATLVSLCLIYSRLAPGKRSRAQEQPDQAAAGHSKDPANQE